MKLCMFPHFCWIKPPLHDSARFCTNEWSNPALFSQIMISNFAVSNLYCLYSVLHSRINQWSSALQKVGTGRRRNNLLFPQSSQNFCTPIKMGTKINTKPPLTSGCSVCVHLVFAASYWKGRRYERACAGSWSEAARSGENQYILSLCEWSGVRLLVFSLSLFRLGATQGSVSARLLINICQ